MKTDAELDDAGQLYSVPPVHRAFRLLRHIAQGGQCRNASATARELGLNRTTLIRLLHTLQAEGMIESVDDGASWQLGSGMIALAADAMKSRSVIRMAQPVLVRLASTLKLSAHLGVLDGREIIYLWREAPNAHLVSNIREGSRLPAHATTVGRVLLGHLPPGEVQARYAAADLAAFTEKTATTPEALLAQIAQDRAQGFAWSFGNYEAEIGSCAAPIHDHRGVVIAALNVTGPMAQFEPGTPAAARIRDAVVGAAEEVSAALGHVDRTAPAALRPQV
jgi:DNA-binding IclR family transcriptional regulator